jgi:tetratricopeptide (TPR) repeat protein
VYKLKAGSLSVALLLLALQLGSCSHRAGTDPAGLYAQAAALYERGELKQALTLADQGLRERRLDPHSEQYWRFRFLKAEVLLVLTRSSEVPPLLPDSLSAVPDIPELQARLLFDRGWLDYERARYSESNSLLDQALQLAQSYALLRLGAEIELRRGAARVRLGNITGGQEDFDSALRFAKQSQDAYLEALALGNLATLELKAARYDEAVAGFGELLNLSSRSLSKSMRARLLSNLGYCYIQLGQPEKAAELFEAAQKLARETGVLVDGTMGLGRLGEWFAGQGQYSTALTYYQRAVDIAKQSHSQYWLAKWLYQTADTMIDVGDLEHAEQFNHQALDLENAIQSPAERLSPQINAGRIAEARKQFSDAERDYRSVISSWESLSGAEEPGPRLEAGGRLATLLVLAHRYAEAEAEFHRTLAFVNASRAELKDADYRITYFASLVHFYQDYVDFLVAQHRDADALSVAESSRARVLAERLGDPDPATAGAASYDYRRLARASGTTLLSYWLAPERSFLWVVTPERVATFTLPRRSEIESLVVAYNGAIEGLRDPARENGEIGRKLYEVLLAPACPFIRLGSNVAIVPDGALHNLNFESLPVTGAEPHYWINDVAVAIVPSLDLAYRHTVRQRNPAQRIDPAYLLLLFGDPAPPTETNLPRLPNALLEISGIRQQFHQATVLTGLAAAPDAYAASKPERFSMIHFAAHAEANHEDPLDSAIILSPQADGYKLYARDVVGLPIRANLVTISACRSAGGRAYAGEGLVGFAWAFLQAGARNVVAGLWEVDDRSTAELMKAMYSELRSGKNPQQSLRAAKLSLLRSGVSYQKPYYWAPFQLITDSLVE